MSTKIEFFWDVASPYTYLASTQLDRLRENTGAEIIPRPFLLGGVFKAAGNTMPASIPAKASFMGSDLARWRDYYGIEMRIPVSDVIFPIRSVTPMRVACTAEDPAEAERLMHILMRGYWVDGADVGAETQLRGVLTKAGLDDDALLAATQDQEIKDLLRANSDEAVERGAFGAPTFLIGDELYWGNDQLVLIEHMLKK